MAALSSAPTLFLPNPKTHQPNSPFLLSFSNSRPSRSGKSCPLLAVDSSLLSSSSLILRKPLCGLPDSSTSGRTSDEWGEKAEPGEDASESVKVLGPDPPINDDEWESGNGVAGAGSGGGDVLGDLKRCLADTVYGTEFGFRASAEVRAEVVEIVNQLEAANPTEKPVESPLLDGKWILIYTAFSELLPLIAVGSTPLLKLENISQTIDTKIANILNTATYSSPFATFSFSAAASFEVRSSSRVQVKFEEGIFQPPQISSNLNLPESLDLFGQNVSLSPLQQALNPLQEAVANFSLVISGQPSLKLPIPGERSQSWLLTTYLDNELRISRGDGGLFILAKENSSLLSQ